jgi:hypothetical protein
MMKPHLLLLIPLISGCAMSTNAAYAERQTAAYAAEMDKALSGKVAGKPQSCINLRDASSTQQVGDKTILYSVNRKLTYRNDPYGGCPGLGRDYTLVTHTWGSELCRGDVVTPIDLTSGFQAGACVLSDFVPYRVQ